MPEAEHNPLPASASVGRGSINSIGTSTAPVTTHNTWITQSRLYALPPLRRNAPADHYVAGGLDGGIGHGGRGGADGYEHRTGDSQRGRRGKKRAIIAVGHTMLVMRYHMLRERVNYKELEHNYLDKLHPHRLGRPLGADRGLSCLRFRSPCPVSNLSCSRM